MNELIKKLGYDKDGNRGLDLPIRKTETETTNIQQDHSISLSKLTVGQLTGGTIQTHRDDNKGVKIIGNVGVDFHGVSSRYLDTSGNVGGMITGINNGGIQFYSTTGQILIDSGTHELRLKYDSMRWDKDPEAEAILAADYYVVVNMNGTDYKLLLKSI